MTLLMFFSLRRPKTMAILLCRTTSSTPYQHLLNHDESYLVSPNHLDGRHALAGFGVARLCPPIGQPQQNVVVNVSPNDSAGLWDKEKEFQRRKCSCVRLQTTWRPSKVLV